MTASTPDQPASLPDLARIADQIETLWDQAEACLIAGNRAEAIQTLESLESILCELRRASGQAARHALAALRTAEALEETSKLLMAYAPYYVQQKLNHHAAGLRLAFTPPPSRPASARTQPTYEEINEAALQAACEDLEQEALADCQEARGEGPTVRDLVSRRQVAQAVALAEGCGDLPRPPAGILRSLAEARDSTPPAVGEC